MAKNEHLPKNKKLLNFAKHMRKNQTKEEKKLWYDFLRYITPKFHRQKIIGNYIADFYCPKLKLIIEVDGGQHNREENIEYDKQRTLFFNSFGYEVIRISNFDEKKNFEGFTAYVLEVCQKKSKEQDIAFSYDEEKYRK